MSDVETFRPRSNIFAAVCVYFLALVYLLQVTLYPTDQNLVADAIVLVLATAFAYFVFQRPKLVLHEDHVVVVNPASKTTINYSDIVDLDTQWALKIKHSRGSTRVWAAPASGRRSWVASRVEDFTRPDNSSVKQTGDFAPASQSVNSHSGLAAALIRQRMPLH
ncbi:MAG: hypothetical protein RL149_628 [Actinomycetota bacterium]|jgi:hypothetical protein